MNSTIIYKTVFCFNQIPTLKLSFCIALSHKCDISATDIERSTYYIEIAYKSDGMAVAIAIGRYRVQAQKATHWLIIGVVVCKTFLVEDKWFGKQM